MNYIKEEVYYMSRSRILLFSFVFLLIIFLVLELLKLIIVKANLGFNELDYFMIFLHLFIEDALKFIQTSYNLVDRFFQRILALSGSFLDHFLNVL